MHDIWNPWHLLNLPFKQKGVMCAPFIGAVSIEDRRPENNLSRKERYHCYSLDAVQFEGTEYAGRETPD